MIFHFLFLFFFQPKKVDFCAAAVVVVTWGGSGKCDKRDEKLRHSNKIKKQALFPAFLLRINTVAAGNNHVSLTIFSWVIINYSYGVLQPFLFEKMESKTIILFTPFTKDWQMSQQQI